jgi:diguanylate cyclase (GGDEF)-like protein
MPIQQSKMVMDRPTRGLALGGARAGVGAVGQAVADHLAASRDVRPSVWIERGGRLRCVARTGRWPRCDGISATAGVVGATFTAGVETVLPDAAAGHEGGRIPGVGKQSAGIVAEACLPISSDGCVVGVLDVGLTRPLRAGDLERFREAAADLGRRIAALGGAPAESAAQRMLRHMTSLSALDEPDAIARAVLAAAIDLMGLDSAALVRRDRDGETDGGGREGGDHAGVERVAGDRPAGPSAAGPPAGAARTSGHDGRDDGPPARRAVATIGPLGPALAATPPEALDALARAAHDGTACAVVATRDDLARSELRTLHAAGARTLVAVGLVAQARPYGVLILAGGAAGAVSIDDIELLELLAAHAATCLRTADLMRSLRERAATDPLTGLGHHATFHEALAGAHRRPRTAVVLVDVDGFKRINDTFGHQHGDQVLREIAGALSGALRRGDTLFRIGGDEFAALLVVAGRDEALEAGLRLRAAVADADLGVTVSIGVAVPQDNEVDASLLARADRALYRVKDAGRDGVALADDEPLPGAPPA